MEIAGLRHRLGGGDVCLTVFRTLPRAPLRELLLPGQREDAVGFLRQVDRADARQHRHEVDRRDQFVRVAADAITQPVEDRRRSCQRKAREERASRSADAEQHREREPEQSDDWRGGVVVHAEAVETKEYPAKAGDAGP